MSLIDVVFPRSCAACGSRMSDPHVPLPSDTAGDSVFDLCPQCMRDLHQSRTPHHCAICSAPVAGPVRACARCRSIRFAFDEHRSVCEYRGSAAALIKAYKFGSRRGLAGDIAHAMLNVIRPAWWHFTVVPVPSRRAAVMRRGYDPVELLAQSIAGHTGARVARLVVNTGRQDQKTLSFEDRLASAAERFRMRTEVTATPVSVLLVDDVFTTGATLSACARLVRERGTQTTCCITFAMEL